MDDLELQKIIKERVSELPEMVRSEIKSEQMNKDIILASEHLKLHVDKLAILEDEVMLLLLGIDTSGSFVENVSERLQISKEDAVTILKKLDSTIFERIRTGIRPTTTPEIGRGQQSTSEPLAMIPASTTTGPKTNQEGVSNNTLGTNTATPSAPTVPVEVKNSVATPEIVKTDPYREPFE